MLAINLIIVCNFVICRQMYAIFKILVFLQTGSVNKVGVVSTSGLNENLELKKKVKQICILPEEFSISLKDLKRACCTVKIR